MFTNFIANLLALIVIGVGVAAAPAEVWYVDDDAPAGGDGTSWAQAFTYLQDALAAASEGDEIRIAQGTYHPDKRSDWPAGGSSDRDVAFELIYRANLYGGYAGIGAADPDERDANTYVTVLSGDLNDDDESAGNAENSRRIVYAVGRDGIAELDGLTITAAASFANESAHSGGVVCVEGAAPRIASCRITGNYKAGDSWTNAGGAGIYARDGSPSCLYSVISDNRAGQSGGGVFTRGGDPDFYQCVIENNIAENRGGGLYCEGPVSVRSCTIRDNQADERGAGGNFEGYTRLEDCTFSENSIDGIGTGGALYISSGELIRCTITDNDSEEDVGGVWCTGDVQLWYCTIMNNHSACGIGGLKCSGSRARLFGCVLTENPGYMDAAGIEADSTELLFSNCTIIDNPSSGHETTGAGIELRDATVTIVNSILQGNSESADLPQVSVIGGTVSISYCDVEGGQDSVEVDSGTLNWGAGNINTAPMFVNPDGDDYHLQPESPCVDAGDPEFEPHENDIYPEYIELDIDGQPRVWPVRVDIGADEIYDCNNNGVADDLDLDNGTLTDADADGVPDECAAADQPDDGSDDGDDSSDGADDAADDTSSGDDAGQDAQTDDDATDVMLPECGTAPCGPGLLGWLPLSIGGLVALKRWRGPRGGRPR